MRRNDLWHCAEHKVDALLLGQAGDHREDGAIEIWQFEFGAQGGSIDIPVLDRTEVELLHDVGVGSRVEEVGIEAIEDPAEGLAPHEQQRFESFAVLWRKDFLGIGWADGGDDVAVVDCLRKEVVEFIGAAVTQVVDSEDGGNSTKSRLAPTQVSQGECQGAVCQSFR